MTVSSPPSYRNTRTNYYTDKASDNNPVGSIISTFISITGVYDNNYIPLNAYNVVPGNSNVQDKQFVHRVFDLQLYEVLHISAEIHNQNFHDDAL